MKNLNHRAHGISLVILMSFFIITCASEPVKVNLPTYHPANPQSQGTAFIPPPNPFKNNIPVSENQAGSSSTMTHEIQHSAHQHKMNPKKDKMDQDSKSSHASETQNAEHQHEEHNQ